MLLFAFPELMATFITNNVCMTGEETIREFEAKATSYFTLLYFVLSPLQSNAVINITLVSISIM